MRVRTWNVSRRRGPGESSQGTDVYYPSTPEGIHIRGRYVRFSYTGKIPTPQESNLRKDFLKLLLVCIM
jgi:hypothetical protein